MSPVDMGKRDDDEHEYEAVEEDNLTSAPLLNIRNADDSETQWSKLPQAD